MDKDFIETCKLLKKHYTRLTRTDASTQSNGYDIESNVAEDIINETKRLLLYEQLDALSDQDIENLRQNSVLKYAKTLENFIMPKSSVRRYECHKNHVRFNDEIFEFDLPNFCNPNSITKAQRLSARKLGSNSEGATIINNLNGRAEYLSEYNQERNMPEQKLLYTEINNDQMYENMDELLQVNIVDNIDKMLKKYCNDEDAVKYHDKIKEEVLKQHYEITEKFNEIKNKVSRVRHKISKIDNKTINSHTNIQDIIEERKNNDDADTYKILEKDKFILKENDKLNTDNNESEDETNVIRNDIYNENIQKENSFINKQVNENNKMKENDENNLTNLVNAERCETNNEQVSLNNDNCIAITGTKTINGKILEFGDIPELNIIPQEITKIENLLEISKLPLETENNKQQYSESNKKLLQKSLIKWKNVSKQNKNKDANITNNKKIEKFLDNFQNYKIIAKKSKSDLEKSKGRNFKENEKKKPKSSSVFENKIASFENRFKAQKNIIEAQKAKLAEQNRIIQELKLNKIKIVAEESLKSAQNEIRKTISSSTKYKHYSKPEQKIETEKAETDNALSLSLNLTKAPKIVQCMEERAREREEKRLLIKERKRLLEEEKKRQTEEAIQRKMKEEAEEKQKRLQKLKEQRKIARELELKKQLEKKHFIEINEMAYAHYKNKLIRSSINKFKMLIYNVRIKVEIANRFYENNIVIKQFKKWSIFTQTAIDNRTNLADTLYRNNLLRKCFNCWKIIYFKRRQNEQVAIDRYDMSLQSKVFIAWHTLTCEYHIQNRTNLSKAEKKYSRNLLFQCFHSWRSFPAIMQIERVQNERKRKWRLRVAEILPDYDPTKECE